MSSMFALMCDALGLPGDTQRRQSPTRPRRPRRRWLAVVGVVPNDSIPLLLEAGADVNVTDTQGTCTVLLMLLLPLII